MVLKSRFLIFKNVLDEAAMCPICCDDITRTLVRCCNNSFCFECISNSLAVSKNCPCCRAVITPDDLIITTGKEACEGGGTLRILDIQNLKRCETLSKATRNL